MMVISDLTGKLISSAEYVKECADLGDKAQKAIDDAEESSKLIPDPWGDYTF